jgi:hypothetical protein
MNTKHALIVATSLIVGQTCLFATGVWVGTRLSRSNDSGRFYSSTPNTTSNTKTGPDTSKWTQRDLHAYLTSKGLQYDMLTYDGNDVHLLPKIGTSKNRNIVVVYLCQTEQEARELAVLKNGDAWGRFLLYGDGHQLDRIAAALK